MRIFKPTSPKGQTAKWSALETVSSTLLGFGIAMLSQMLIFPLYGIQASLNVNFQITCWFTIVSLLRGYFVRRFFNWLHSK